MSEWKETDIGQIPIHWYIMTVDEIKAPSKKSIISGPFGSNISAKYFVESGVPVVRGNNLSLDIQTKFKDNGFVFVTEEKANELGTWAEKNDIIFTAVGTIGQVGILLGKEKYSKYIISNKQLRLRVNTEVVEPLYAYYWFASPFMIDMILQRNTGSSVPLINLSVLKSLLIPLPPKDERISILNILSSLDDKIDLLHRQNATLEKMAETLFRQWFVEEAKEEWEEVELGNLIDVVIDNRGKTPPTVEFETEYPLIEVNALNSQSCLVDYTVIRKYVAKETFDTWFRKHLKVNDIIISTVGTIGVFSIHLANKGCIAQNLVGLRSSRISSYFLYCFFKSNIETLINLDIGGVQPSIKVPHLLGLKIKLPPKDLLNEFNESVGIYFNKIAINQTQIRTLTALRDALLPKLMSGEVRVV